METYAKDDEKAKKIALFEKIKSKIEASQMIKGVILFGKEAKKTQNSGMDIDIMLLCEEMPREDLEYLQNSIMQALHPMKVELVFFNEITDEKIQKDIEETGIYFWN